MQPIALGSAGPEVLDVQRRLAGAGLTCDDDPPGEFGDATRRAVRVFQQERGLSADGVVGDETWSALVEAGYQLGDRLLYLTRPYLRGDDVLELQRRLNQLGFDSGYTDGVFGPQTADAIREFQLNVGSKVDGIAGPRTHDALMRLHRQHQRSPAFAVREREALLSQRRESIAGARILVDPGHGAGSPGFEGPDGITEQEVTWQLATRVAGRLGALGAHAVLARGPGNCPSTSERAALANREQAEAILSIHLNGLPQHDASGAAGYYFGHDGYISERGRLLAQLCVDHVVAETGTVNCRTHPSTMTILRESRAPAVIVEPGFLTHPEEGRLLCDPEHQNRIAHALTEALNVFLLGGSPERTDEAADRRSSWSLPDH